MLFEIRNYHVKPDLLEAYKAWGKAEAGPFLSKHLDVVGFWIKTNDAPVIHGEPQDRLAAADLTWIIRWRDVPQRNEVMSRLFAGAEWQDIVSGRPGGTATYLRTESKFTESVL